MIGAEIKSLEKRRAKHSAKYAAGENEQEKVLAFGHMNCFAETFDAAVDEMDADDLAYNGNSDDNVSHWVFSVHADENLTPDMAVEFIQGFLKDQGMEGHKCAWGLHQNTENLHIHLTFLRTKPEPEENGSYKIQNYGGRVKWANGTNNRYECSRATIIDFCQKYGLKDDFTEVAARPSDPDAIRLSQEIRTGEAQSGKPSPKRLIGEAARDEIRAFLKMDKPTMNDLEAGLSGRSLGLSIREDGKGASIIGPKGERIPLSLLPQDCSLKNIQRRIDGEGKSFEAPKGQGKGFYEGKLTVNRAKSLARKEITAATSLEDIDVRLAAKGMRIERYGKSGAYLIYGESEADKMKLSALGGKYSLSALHKRFNVNSSPYASKVHESQTKVNASSRKDASEHASTVQSDRASSAQERAETAEDRAAQAGAAATQAGAEAGEDFYDLDFFEQISVLQRVAGVEAAARAATAREHDEKRKAQEWEARAKRAEAALSMSQQLENTHINNKEVEIMNEFKPDYHIAKTAAMLACHSLAELKDRVWAAKELEDLHHALTGAGRIYQIRPEADTQALLEATSRLGELCNDVHRYSDDDAMKAIPAALAQVHAEAEKVSITTDADASKNPGEGSGKAQSETGLSAEKTAQAVSEKEIQTPKRKFSFGNMFGSKKFGGSNGGPTNGPKM